MKYHFAFATVFCIANGYELLNDAMRTWDEAQEACQSIFGTNLASVHSATDEAAVTALCTDNDCYIGLRRPAHDLQGWEWSDGTPVDYGNDFSGGVFPWGSGEPNDYKNNEDCAEVRPNHNDWNDISCTDEQHAICNSPTFGFRVCSEDVDNHAHSGSSVTVDYLLGTARYSCSMPNDKSHGAVYSCNPISTQPAGQCGNGNWIQINLGGSDDLCISHIIFDGEEIDVVDQRLGDQVDDGPVHEGMAKVYKRRYYVANGAVTMAFPHGFETNARVEPECTECYEHGYIFGQNSAAKAVAGLETPSDTNNPLSNAISNVDEDALLYVLMASVILNVVTVTGCICCCFMDKRYAVTKKGYGVVDYDEEDKINS